MRMARNTGGDRIIDIVRPRLPVGDWFDREITEIATFRSPTIATRSVLELENCGVEVVEPWPEQQ